MSRGTHLTDAVVRDLKPGEKRYTVWSDESLRFGVVVEPTGTKTFILDYRAPDGRRRRLTLGRFGATNVEKAGKEARDADADTRRGVDPLQSRQNRRAGLTFGDAVERYLDEYAVHAKPRSLRSVTRCLTKCIPDRITRLKLASVTRDDIAGLHRSMSKTPIMANRMLAAVSCLYGAAETWTGVLPDGHVSPTHRVPRNKETARTRYLDHDEYARLGAVLTSMEATHPYPVRAIRLLLLTGCRCGEILSLAWDDVDLKNAQLHLRDAKAGARNVPLGGPAIALLAAADHGDSQWVIPGQKPGCHLARLDWPWQSVRKAAGIEDVHIHDLRHCVGATGAGAGLSLLLIGNVLGHKSTASTMRYSHVGRTPGHDAADRISTEISALLNGTPEAEVVKLRG